MTDLQFLDHCKRHANTTFTGAEVRRLFLLSGEDMTTTLADDESTTVRRDLVVFLVARARKRLK